MTHDFKQQEEKAEHKLEKLLRQEEEESVKIIAKKYKIPYADISTFPIDIDALILLPEEKARAGMMAVFQATGKRLKIAVRNPKNETTFAYLKDLEKEGYKYDLFLVSRRGLEHVWEVYKHLFTRNSGVSAGRIQISDEAIEVLKKEITDLSRIKDRVTGAIQTNATETLEIILAGGLSVNASDIHVEPQEETTRLRFRLDGVLHDVVYLTTKLYQLLLSRIKLVSELKLNIHDKAQDGRFTIKTEGLDVEVRVSILPGPYGENIVLRILNPKAIEVEFEDLGMQPWVVKTIEAELKKPNGMILTTGPTGSGKTTTLYAFLKKIRSPENKIITIEDPIEYHLKGVEQSQVDPSAGYDFANGLRSIVRQDPDVILVGEIRDLETAETAMHAALTGHLVFSTIHTNSAAGTVPRLMDLGVKPNIIAPAINVTIGQRLLRRLCAVCATEDEQARNAVRTEFESFPEEVPIPSEQEWKILKAAKSECANCNGTGYKGRIGVFELILIDEQMELIIMQNPSELELKKEAFRQKQITMRQDGILKIAAGMTDFNELERVVGS